MVRLLLGADGLFVPLLAAADDRVRDVERGQPDSVDARGVETFPGADIQDGLQR